MPLRFASNFKKVADKVQPQLDQIRSHARAKLSMIALTASDAVYRFIDLSDVRYVFQSGERERGRELFHG